MSIKTGLEYVGCIDPWTDEERLSGEEIVRCRDCKHFEKDATPNDEWYPHFCSKLGTDVVTPGGFCSWGERKEDE